MSGLEKGTLFTHPAEDKGTKEPFDFVFLNRKKQYEEATEITNNEGSKSDVSYRWLH